MKSRISRTLAIVLLCALLVPLSLYGGGVSGESQVDLSGAIEAVEAELVSRHGDAARPRIERGLQQVASLWRSEDGDAVAFESFALDNFVASEEGREELLRRLDFIHEQLDGNMLEINRSFRRQADLDIGEILPVDSGYHIMGM